jgi:hypothetical protein
VWIQAYLPSLETIKMQQQERFKMKVNDDAFARMVAEEVKNKLSPLHKSELMKEENWHLWQAALIALSENLQSQILTIESDAESDEKRYSSLGVGGKKLSHQAASYYGDKATRIKRFKFHVDKRLDEVSLMIETGQEMESDGWEKVDFFRRAITKHRSMLREYDMEDTAIDRSLWATLDYKWTFDAITEEDL